MGPVLRTRCANKRRFEQQVRRYRTVEQLIAVMVQGRDNYCRYRSRLLIERYAGIRCNKRLDERIKIFGVVRERAGQRQLYGIRGHVAQLGPQPFCVFITRMPPVCFGYREPQRQAQAQEEACRDDLLPQYGTHGAHGLRVNFRVDFDYRLQ